MMPTRGNPSTTKPEAAFDLPEPMASAISPAGGPQQSSNQLLPGTFLEKFVVSKVVRPVNVETPVLQIPRPCSAVDVYVDISNLATSAHARFAVRIYAVTGGVRALVGTGRVSKFSALGVTDRPLNAVKHVASARVCAERFEITIATDAPGGGAADPGTNEEFPISAIGYQATDSHPLARPQQVLLPTPWLAGGGFIVSNLGRGELLAIRGSNDEAVERFLQVWDANASPAVDAAAIQMEEFLVPAHTRFDHDYDDFPLEFGRGLVLCNSTTSGAFVANAAGLGTICTEVR